MTAPVPGGKRRVVLGVAGGIAAYKACELLRRLTESGHDVTVVPTEAALHFVGEATWSALSGKPAHTRVWDDVHHVPHVRLGQHADLVVVAPATADLLAKAAHGLADDLLTSTLLTARCPVLLAPAMHTEMWEHPATVANVATLRDRGVIVLDPAHGRLTGADSGPGRLPEPESIAAACERLLDRPGAPVADLAGITVLVSAGGTREPLDPVRYIGNRSSGLQGYALASAAAARGARVVLVSANVSLPDPAGVEVVRVGSAAQLRDAVLERGADCDVIVMAAAVADFRPVTVADHKIKKEFAVDSAGSVPEPVVLERTDDVLALTVAARAESHQVAQVIVGFAAETGDDHRTPLDHARDKLVRKGVDLLVLNDVSGGRVFGESGNAVTLLGADGSEVGVPFASKDRIADAIWDRVVTCRAVKIAG